MIIIFYIVAINIAILVMTYFLVKQHNRIVNMEHETTYYKSIIDGLKNELIFQKQINSKTT